MYLKKVHIQNIRSLSDLTWQVDENNAAGWHVILGNNGAGKSTLVRSIALALIGPSEAQALRQDWNDWLSTKQTEGHIDLSLMWHEGYDIFTKRGRRKTNDFLPVGLKLLRESEAGTGIAKEDGSNVRLLKDAHQFDPNRNVWGGGGGWFCVSYGPFRRFTGGDKDYERIFFTNPRIARHLSVFDESVALTESLRWLQDLQFKKLEETSEGLFLDAIKVFVNQPGFLPYQARLEAVTSRGVEFVDGNGCQLSIQNLSDGYRSILSMTFELLRQLQNTYRAEYIFDDSDPTKVDVPGVVIIDEVDAHLHPTWQRRIGVWFRTHFPNIQFIVTTHSPLVCQAAEHGTVYKLPTPGTDEKGHMIEGAELNRLLYGNILEAYSTEAFGSGITRSEASRQRTKRLAELNRKELHGELTEAEEQEQNELRAMLPTTAHTLSEEAAA